LISISCHSQIIDIYGPEDYGKINGAYYKDVTNFHNQYVGTWLYTNGTTSLKLKFKTVNYVFCDLGTRSFYEDVLIGEYQYIENGVEKVNTLNNIDVDYGTEYLNVMTSHYLRNLSCIFFPNSGPVCNECLPNERRMEMGLSEPGHNGMGVANTSFVLRRYFENGVEKLKVWFINMTQITFVDDNGNETSPAPYKLPTGEYILTKL
jgi:hypothetical protein